MANRLQSESSPYLLQHKDNPVFWEPWGEEAFARARRENKPIFLSIGYSTCYWCHVMEKDSFEREDVAAVLNSDFVAIKVDREERPDVDQIYMDVVVGLTGHGGWPMSVFLTPELQPFWGGTFFYRAQFLQILAEIARIWKSDPGKVQQSASQIVAAIAAHEHEFTGGNLSLDILNVTAHHYRDQFDSVWGGFGRAPKFPPSCALQFLLRYGTRFPQGAQYLEMAEHTLVRMAHGGIHDHVGGGFSRYSVDERWCVPHFEKMLYDNALLAATYFEAYAATGNALYRDVAERACEFVARELRHEGGAFFAALDAGEVGEEGAYYVWSHNELRQILDEDLFAALSKVYEVTEEGNFEGNKIVLCCRQDQPAEILCDTRVRTAMQLLFQQRKQRRYPHRDEKIIAAWNGLMLTALARGCFWTGNETLRVLAEQAAEFICREMLTDSCLYRSYAAGRVSGAGCLDDYAALVEGLLNLYMATGAVRWFHAAVRLQTLQDRLFWDAGTEVSSAGYRYSTARELIVQKREILDGATPSGSSIALANLARLSLITGDSRYRERAQTLSNALAPYFNRYPWGMVKAVEGLDLLLQGAPQLVLVAGEDGEFTKFQTFLRQNYLPQAVVVQKQASEADEPPLCADKAAVAGRTTLYLCRDFHCERPITNLEELQQLWRRS